MTPRWSMLALLLAAVLALTACTRFSGKPAPGPEVPRPDSVLDAIVLYSQNCAGCHGADGKGTASSQTPNLTDSKVQSSLTDEQIQATIEVRGRHQVGQIALVPLECVRQAAQLASLFGEVRVEIVQ